MPRSNPLDRAIRNFQRGIASGIIGFAYGVIVEVLLKTFLGPYIPVVLISGALFLIGVASTAETITDQNHWFVLGVAFITWYLDPFSLVLGIALFLLGYFLRQHYLE